MSSPIGTAPGTGKAPGKDFLCAAAPGTAAAFTFNVDSFAMYKLKSADAQKAQADLAAAIDRTYGAVRRICFEGMHYRTDIGRKGLSRWPSARG